MKISKHAFASDKSILKVCLCVCVCVCAQYMWQTVCRRVGWGESSTSSAERWASVSHGPWALSGLGSCLVIGYLPDLSLRLDRTHTHTNTHPGWWRTRKDERERSNKECWEDLIRGRMKEKEKLTLCLRVSVSVADNAEGSQQHQCVLFLLLYRKSVSPADSFLNCTSNTSGRLRSLTPACVKMASFLLSWWRLMRHN